MAQSAYDCIVIGSGPGGYVAAIRAAQLGKSTAVVESDKVGGRCLNYACIPAKALLRSADLLSEIRDSEEFGLKVGDVRVDYAGLGSEVLLIEAVERVLPTEDADISRVVERGLKRQGVQVHTGTPVTDVDAGEDAVSLAFGSERASVDYLVIAAGRAPDAERLGLADAGVQLDERGFVRVDGAQRTSRERVYAIGDLVAGPALAHKASDEGIIAAEHSAGLDTRPLAHVDVPRATFCLPNVGSFGLTEAQATEQGYEVVVGKVAYGAVGGGTVYGDRTGMVKIVGERRYGELLGGHIVGSRATELIQELVNVRVLEGGFPEVARIVHGHPTLSEAVMEAARAADGWLIHG